MLGGYQILNLTVLNMELGSSLVTITDEGVLKQLRELRDYIQPEYDFNRPLNNKLKPILLRLRDKKANEKEESSVWANLSVVDNNLKFVIEGLVDCATMKVIKIEVVFEEKTDEYSNKYYGIKTAKYMLTNAVNIKGGQFDGVVFMQNIKDSQGNDRNFEHDITVPDNLGFTPDYAHLVLNGYELHIVVAGSVDTNTPFTLFGIDLDDVLPQWVKDKLIPMGQGDNVAYALIYCYENGTGLMHTENAILCKSSSTHVFLYSDNLTLSEEYTGSFRIQFSVIIDNKAPQNE